LARSIATSAHSWSRYYERLRLPPELRARIDEAATAAVDSASSSARGALALVGTGLAALPALLLIPVLAFFLLKDAAAMRGAVLAGLPRGSRDRGARLFEDLSSALASFIRAQILACVLVGVVCGLAFGLMRIPYSVVFGVMAAVFEFIPLIGPLAVAVTVAVVAGVHSFWLALGVLGFLGVLRVVEDYVVYPRLMRRGVELHPLTVILAVVAGGELNGIVGMFLAVPVAAIASVLVRHWLDWRGADAGCCAGVDSARRA
jgi:predicted PurR-regulated permease PerM